MILFRLADVDDGDEQAEYATAEGDAVERDTEPEGPAAQATTTLAPVRQAQPIEEAPPRTAPPPGKRRRRRVPTGLIAVVVVLAIVGAGLWTASRAVYFVGVDPQGTVTIYRGLPYDLPFGLELYEPYYSSGVTLAQVPEDRRNTFTDHQLRPKDDAEDLVSELERGRIQ